LEPWVSDGTESGTHLLKDIKPGALWSWPIEFISLGDSVYFVTDDNIDIWNALWKTDGTESGTTLVKDLGLEGDGGYYINQLTEANGLLFFAFASYTSFSWELWRTDGSEKGSYSVSKHYIYPYVPAQLTSYNNQLYFSADDGNGRNLWCSDGSVKGTKRAINANNTLIDADNFGIQFPILNNVLYLPGYSFDKQGGLYKYDASNSDGLVKVKDLTSGSAQNYIVPSEMTAAGGHVYFAVINYNDAPHYELWSSDGEKSSTKALAKYLPTEAIGRLYNGNDKLYFVKSDALFGAELWQVLNTVFGTFPIIQSDVFSGGTSSYPFYLTAFNGKVFFSATSNKGTELYMTDDIGFGATLVKDINTVATSSSFAGIGSAYITSTGKEVFFDAYENVAGDELYKSDGTEDGTVL
jgi:ELWxxDGT repeat protein